MKPHHTASELQMKFHSRNNHQSASKIFFEFSAENLFLPNAALRLNYRIMISISLKVIFEYLLSSSRASSSFGSQYTMQARKMERNKISVLPKQQKMIVPLFSCETISLNSQWVAKMMWGYIQHQLQ